MSKTFTTTLVGRRFTPIPPRTQPNWHVRDDLPQGVVYLVHTAYLDESLPTVVGERIDMKEGWSIGFGGREVFEAAPQSVTVAVAHFGVLWELLPA